ncbi:hypothetical protein QBC46DRAFT_161543 [Diplogelasinospora grovesii]|uniref:Uncharacterized protein n=1 Tax=Diplogelasinospora grovesii TaxID=303347 RepID=A0AAN6N782_9PEZI|nr:hypothetical protein QBC46DRAFT_161543 [Diplogelasinospora grovesii]
MENSRQFDRLFGQLRDLEPAEIAPALASMADYHDLPFHHFQAQQYLRQLVDARTRLEAAGEYAQADQRRNAAGYTSELYLPPRDGHDFQRPLWVRDLEGDHDIALMDLRRTLLHSSWMIENLCRDLVAPTIRAAVVTSLLYANAAHLPPVPTYYI